MERNADLILAADVYVATTTGSVIEAAELVGSKTLGTPKDVDTVGAETTEVESADVVGVDLVSVENVDLAGVNVENPNVDVVRGNVEKVGVDVASCNAACVEATVVEDNVRKESTPKHSLKRKMSQRSNERAQKEKRAGKRVLLNPAKRTALKWQRYKKPTIHKRYSPRKTKHVSVGTSALSQTVPNLVSAQSCVTESESEHELRTGSTQSVTSETVLSNGKESKQEDDQQTATVQRGISSEKVDVSATVSAVHNSETESSPVSNSETADDSLRIDDGETGQGAETGLCHLKQLTEELSQLGRDSARLVTARQSRKAKKRKQKSDEHVPGQQPDRRTSSPIRNVKRQAKCDLSEEAFAEELGLTASCSKGSDVDSMVPDNTPQGDTSVSKEIESIDETLEEKSKRFLLTAKNVRSIVHELVTNEQVLAMMCNSLNEGHRNDEPRPTVYEPKMTRSKVKEVIEMGQLPSPWILSPIKVSKKNEENEPHFLEMTFSDDEEDEEYRPTEDELKVYSEVGTPASMPSVFQGEGTVDSSFGRSDEDSQAGQEETATIAWRTRSKLPLQDTPLEEIELGFVAPDISADMYDTYCDDSDWKNFLCSIVKSDGRQDVNDSLDDEADPEYNFLAEVEKEEVDAEDFRTDKDVRVTKKELHELMDELFEAYGAGCEQPTGVKAGKDAAKTKKQKHNKNNPSDETAPQLKFVGDLVSASASSSEDLQETDAVPLVTAEEKIQIHDQMRKHVQLLTQTYVQAADRSELTELSDLARLFLMELKALGDKANLTPGLTSFFHSCNLSEALDVVNRPLLEPNEACNENLKQLMVANYVPKNVYEVYGLNYEQMETFMTRAVFMFPQMLPECRLLHGEHRNNKRVLFSQAEDNLLAMGIEQFGHLINKYAYIEQYMLPTKKKQQLRYRFKNLKADRTTGENSMKYLSKHNTLPEFPRFLELEDPADVVPPQDRDPDLLPGWGKAFQAARLNHQSNCQSALTGVTGWVQVVSVVPSADSIPENGTTPQQQQKKPPPGPARQPNSKKFGVSGLNRFHTGKHKKATSSLSPPSSPAIYAGLPAKTTATTETLSTDTVDVPVSDSQDTVNAGTLCRRKPDVVINAAVLSPGSLLGGAAAVKMATVLRPGFRATSSATSTPAVSMDEPLIMLTARQLSQLGVKINMMPVGGDTTVQLSSPSGKGTVMSVGSGLTGNTLLPSMQAGGNECKLLSRVALTSVTLSTSATTTRCSSVVRVSQDNDTGVTPIGDTGDVVSGDAVNITLSTDAEVTDAADVTVVDAHPRDDTATAGDVNTSVTSGVSLLVNPPMTVTSADAADRLINTVTDVTVNKRADTENIPTDAALSPAVLPHVIATLTDSQNRTPQIIPGTPSPQKISPSKCSLFYDSPSRKSTVFHRLQRPQQDPPKARRTIDILPHPPHPVPHFSTGSSFYQSPSKQITFLQPPGGSSGFADVSVNRNLAFSLRSPSKSAVATNRRCHAVYISPVKKAAAKITARLKKVRKVRKLERILPKPPEPALVLSSLTVEAEQSQTPIGVGDIGDASLTTFGLGVMGEKANIEDIPKRPPTEPVTPREEVVAVESESDGESVKGVASRPESATGFDDDDNDDEDHLAQLMAASTTIRFAPKLPLTETDICLTKAKKKRAVLLELLEPDLLAKDPLRDERDTAFAQAYLTTAKDMLLGNNRPDVYEQLLKLLHDFGQSDKSPVELYEQLRAVLRDFPQLVQEFIVFLLPEQAKECDCFMENLECHHARTFLRKLEVHLRKHPSQLQKIINIFLQWQSSQVNRDVSQLKEAIRPLLRGQQHLLDEFCWFFGDEPPPESCLTEFEEVTLKDSEEDEMEEDDYEEVQMPEGDELLGSQWCQCPCHQSDFLLYHRRKKHCRACRSTGIKIVKGRIYVQTSESSLKPARVVYHSPESARSDPTHIDTCSIQPSAKSNDEPVKMEPGGKDAGRPVLGSSTRPLTQAQKTGQLTAMCLDSRPQTPACGSGDVAKILRIDTQLAECVRETDGTVVNAQQSGTSRDVVMRSVEAGRQTDMTGVTGPTPSVCTWTKEEDKHILESCKQHGLGGSTFQTVAANLKTSAESVSKRFYELMQLFNEQPSDPSENDSDNESDGSPVG